MLKKSRTRTCLVFVCLDFVSCSMNWDALLFEEQAIDAKCCMLHPH